MAVRYQLWNNRFKHCCFLFLLFGCIIFNQYDLLSTIRKVRIPCYVLSIILLIIEIVNFNLQIHWSVLYNASLFILLVSCLNFVYFALNNLKLKTNIFLHDSNFFIYAYHGLVIVLFMKLLIKIICPTTEIQIIAIYFISPVLTILLGLLVFRIMRTVLPKFTALITGSRL